MSKIIKKKSESIYCHGNLPKYIVVHYIDEFDPRDIKYISTHFYIDYKNIYKFLDLRFSCIHFNRSTCKNACRIHNFNSVCVYVRKYSNSQHNIKCSNNLCNLIHMLRIKYGLREIYTLT